MELFLTQIQKKFIKQLLQIRTHIQYDAICVDGTYNKCK